MNEEQMGDARESGHVGDAAPGPAIAPLLSVRSGARAVEVCRVENPSGAVVSRLSIGGAEFRLSDESPEHGNFSPETLGGGTVRMILTVADPDAAFAQALAAGARAMSRVEEEHGWRIGRVCDRFGHHWEIGRPV
jgi:PhnB protein